MKGSMTITVLKAMTGDLRLVRCLHRDEHGEVVDSKEWVGAVDASGLTDEQIHAAVKERLASVVVAAYEAGVSAATP